MSIPAKACRCAQHERNGRADTAGAGCGLAASRRLTRDAPQVDAARQVVPSVEAQTPARPSGSTRPPHATYPAASPTTCIPPSIIPAALRKVRSTSPGLSVHFLTRRSEGRTWVLRWETQGRNRDKPHPTIPPPSELRPSKPDARHA